MPVRVDVPTRVRVDPGALTDRRADLEDALGAAAGRALANSADVVLRPRASYATARLNPPEFTWYGAGLGEVPTSVRTEVEESLADVLWRAAERAGLARRTDERPRALERVLETVDDSRYDRLLALYEIPSYDGAKQPKLRMPVGGDAHRVKQEATELKPAWYRLRSNEADEQYFIDFDAKGYSVHTQQYMGPIYLGYDGRFHIRVYKYPGQELLDTFTIYSFTQLKRDEKTREIVEVEGGGLEPLASYEISWFAEGGPAAEPALRAFYTPAITALLKDGAPADWAKVDIAPRVDKIVRDKLEQKDVRSWLMLTVNGADSLMSLDYVFPREVYTARLLPVYTYFEVPVSRAGKGIGGAGEAAKAAGAAGTAADGTAGAPGQPSPAGLESPLPGEAGFLPPSPMVNTDELTCESYRGEPSYKELGQMGLELKEQMERISHLLAIPPCEYIGNFLHNAAQALGGRAASIEEFDPEGFEPAEVRSTPNGDGNLGPVEFIPKPSAQIVMMRRLAAVVPLMHQLKSWMEAAYEANPNSISGAWSGDPLGWEIRHGYFMNKTMEVSVANIFARTCQVLFLQLLKTSKAEIEKRQRPGYAEAFEHILLPQLMPLSELIRVREILDHAWSIEYARYGFMGGPATQYNADRFKDVRFLDVPPATSPPAMPASWEDAWRNLTGSLAPKPVVPPPATGDLYELFKQDGSYRVRDLHGHVWSSENLEMRITLLKGALETADPLIKQFHDIPAVMARFTAAQAREQFFHTTGLVKAELDNVLDEMHRENKSRTEEAQSEWLTAFKTSEIVEGYGGVHIPGTGYTLQGIHKMAHEQIGEAFHEDTWYALGVDYLFTVEDKKLLKKIISIDLMLLSILVPPLGEFLNLVYSAWELGEAQKKEAAWKALIDPDEVMNWAAIEAELFAAKLGMVFAAIPYVGRAGAEIKAVATKAFARGAVEVAEEVAVATAREASGLARFGAAALELLELTQRSIISAVVAGMAEQLLIGEVLSWVIDPMIQAVQREAEKQAPVGGLEHALDLIAQRLAERRAAAEVETGATP